MKAAATRQGARKDIYNATLAPVDSPRTPFRGVDAVLLVVLFLEFGVVIRLILAN